MQFYPMLWLSKPTDLKSKIRIMYINVRVRLKTGEAVTVKAEIPDDIKDYGKDTIDDAVSDWLDENKIEYKWYRVENESE